MLFLTNNAPDGTPLVVTDMSAEISLPAGDDNIPDSIDDPLRIAQREEGAESVVSIINVDDMGPDIAAQESGEGKFYVEGLKEGTHQIDIDIKGTLLGLPSGPVEVSGTAVGTVLVRNPNFSLTFGHPNVVRAGEEYSLFVTVNNISQADANLVRLNLSSSAVFGASVVDDSDPESDVGTVEFRTIEAGDSAVAEFKMIARTTGKVTSTAFHGVDGALGVFKLRTGVNERGIPLSSDSLILSSYVKNLPESLLFEAMRVLGLAHSVATAPVLPPDITRISGNTVFHRALELNEAGLRIQMGESVENSIYDLIMEWLGSGAPDEGFEEVLNGTDAGRDFLTEAGRIIGVSGALNTQWSFGNAMKYRDPFVSATIENTDGVAAYLEITDESGKSTGRDVGGALVLGIPHAVLIDIDGDQDTGLQDMALLDNVRIGEHYDLTVRGIGSGTVNIGLIIPDSAGGFIHAEYQNIAINNGETITGQIIAGTGAPILWINSISIPPSVVNEYETDTGPKIIGVMQLPDEDWWDRGRVVGILFDEKVSPESANNPANYELLYRNLEKDLRNQPKSVKVLH